MNYHPTSTDIGPELSHEGARGGEAKYECRTCNVKLTAQHAVEHVTLGHDVYSRKGVLQRLRAKPRED